MPALSPERWRQIDALFAEALDLPPDERTAFLRHACGDDPALYREVVALLESACPAEQVLGESVTQFAAPLLAALESDLGAAEAPARLGPYRLIGELGRGGMGTVYLAERADGQFEQHVALKLVKRGMDTDEILRRFRHERQILASLQHPHIAQLYDGGVADDGRPYLVMEYVDGRPIGSYCDAHTLRIDERLTLFAAVAEAVQYAHRNLVVHRDLKPGNILVTDDGQVKLLDFGIAKLLDDEASDRSVPVTQAGVRVMTPAYAAPEQIHGGAITTATDVYALGVILYELLTGHRPLPLKGQAPREAEQTFLNTALERPSTAVTRPLERRQPDGTTTLKTPEALSASRATSVERLQKQLRGDLDTILLKALRKEPERRYASPEAFLDDIQRHQAGLPVQARPDTLGYRVGKFIKRHRFSVSAAGVFVLLLSAFAIALGVQQAQTARERDRAEQERDKAERVVTVFTEMLEAADPGEARGDTLTVYEALSQSRQHIDTALVELPAVQAEMYSVLGRVYRGMGRYEQSQAVLKQALALRQTTLEASHPEVAETLTDLAEVTEKAGDYEAAEAYHQQALALRQHRLGDTHPATIESLNRLASLFYRRGDLPNASARLEELLAVNRQVFGDHHLATATVLHDLGTVLKRMEAFDRAAEAMREALAIRRDSLGADHPLVLSTLSNLASLLSDSGAYDEAEAYFREVMVIRRRILGNEHPDLALTLAGLGVVLQRKGALDEAERFYKQALAINEKELGPDHPTVGLDLATLAKLLQEKGETEEAEQNYGRALTIFRARFPPEHPAIALPLVNWGRLLVEKQAYARALPMLQEGFTIRTAGFGPTYWGTAQAQGALGACLLGLGRYDEAEPLLTESYALLLDQRGPDDANTNTVRHHLINLYNAWGQPDKAAVYQKPSEQTDP